MKDYDTSIAIKYMPEDKQRELWNNYINYHGEIPTNEQFTDCILEYLNYTDTAMYELMTSDLFKALSKYLKTNRVHAKSVYSRINKLLDNYNETKRQRLATA